MMDQYFGNDSLEPFEIIFIGTTLFLIAFIWLSTVLENAWFLPMGLGIHKAVLLWYLVNGSLTLYIAIELCIRAMEECISAKR